MFNLQPSTWRLLGLSVAAGYTAFGAFEILVPAKAMKEMFAIEPKKNPEVDETVSLVAPLLGARDLSIAAAIFVLHHAKWDRAMGVVIVSGTILCFADAVAVGYRKGPQMCVSTGLAGSRSLMANYCSHRAVLFAGGASIWGVIGLGLMDC